MLAAGAARTISLWDVENGELRRRLQGHLDMVTSVAWSPDGQSIASASDDGTVRLWEAETGNVRQTLTGHQGWVTSVSWSPDGQTLASGASDETIGLWNTGTGELHRVLRGHFGRVTNLAWSPDGRMLASTSVDATVRLWDTGSWAQIGVLEGHHLTVRCASFSPDGLLLASKSFDDTVRLWRLDSWEPVAYLDEPASGNWAASLAFHPRNPVLATLGEEDCVIRIWDVDEGALLAPERGNEAVHYTNAKVVLVGDSGVGKSGLGLVLAGTPFRPTESTHGRHVWTFESRTVPLGSGRMETRETLLWDLAGQPGYRLIHQLHLNEVTVALVVFDAKSETEAFAGVQ
jgi:WD40 repeat protein